MTAKITTKHDLFLAEASYVDDVPADTAGTLSSARQVGRQAQEAGVRHLLLTHLLPGTDRQAAHQAAAAEYNGEVDVTQTFHTWNVDA